MPLPNRVTPFGDIVAVPDRGMLFGNRGVLHDDGGGLVRAWQGRRWIACLLVFRGRRRPLLRPGRFTELFFLDEATALSAGHRPCAECRRDDFVRFRDLWVATRPGSPGRVDAIDRVLHEERRPPGPARATFRARLGDLPTGTMVVEDGEARLVAEDALYAWSPSGYGDAHRRSAGRVVDVLTPPSIVAVLRAGYRPSVHPSATG